MRRDGAKAPARPRPDDGGDDDDDGHRGGDPCRESGPLRQRWRGDCYGGSLKPVGTVSQRRLHFPRCVIASGWVVLEGALDSADERGRQIGTQIAQSSRLLVRVRSSELFDRRSGDRKLPAHEIEEQYAEPVEVALNGCRLAGKNLRRQIERGTGHARGALGVAKLFARPEIHQHGAPAALTQDVLRLDVSMDEASGVNRCQRGAEILTDDHRLTRSERSAREDDLLQRFAAYELHPQADAAVVLLRTVHLHHVRVTDARQPARLREDAIVGRRIGLSAEADIVESFERDLAMQFGIPGAEDLA